MMTTRTWVAVGLAVATLTVGAAAVWTLRPAPGHDFGLILIHDSPPPNETVAILNTTMVRHDYPRLAQAFDEAKATGRSAISDNDEAMAAWEFLTTEAYRTAPRTHWVEFDGVQFRFSGSVT